MTGTHARIQYFLGALQVADPGLLQELYWCARVSFVTDVGEIGIFDEVFMSTFGRLHDEPPETASKVATSATAAGSESAPKTLDSSNERDQLSESDQARTPSHTAEAKEHPDPSHLRALSRPSPTRASSAEALSERDFSTLTPQELRSIATLMHEMTIALPFRLSRRRTRSQRGAGVDLRSTLRQARRTGGDPLTLVTRGQRKKPRRLVFLLDISGSMESYVRPYFQFAYAASRVTPTEVFSFATRLTRITNAVKSKNPDLALQWAGTISPDWSSGTRIARSLEEFLRHYGRRGAGRGAVLVIACDGWEHGSADDLRTQMERISRITHRIIWVNPRKAQTGYEPRAAGMAAALPFCDAFVSGHSLSAMREVVGSLGDGT